MENYPKRDNPIHARRPLLISGAYESDAIPVVIFHRLHAKAKNPENILTGGAALADGPLLRKGLGRLIPLTEMASGPSKTCTQMPGMLNPHLFEGR